MRLFLLSSFFAGLVPVALSGVMEREAKREVDSTLTRPIIGGGKLDKATLARLAGRNSDGDVLLDEGPQLAPLPETHSFLAAGKYENCTVKDPRSQGEICNSCWAFATQNMLQARRCKWMTDGGQPSEEAFLRLSPLNLICKLQDQGFCGPKDLGAALEYARDTGILKAPWIGEWLQYRRDKDLRSDSKAITDTVREQEEMGYQGDVFPARGRQARLPMVGRSPFMYDKRSFKPAMDGTVHRRSMEALTAIAQRTIDESSPSPEKCEELFKLATYAVNLVRAPSVMVSSAPFTQDRLKRSIFVGGPVIGTMRLSWDFLVFSGALFNPSEPQTFCRMAKPTDARDYCDPGRKATWDAEQHAQQVRPAAADREAWEESWYNHFVTLHGWGVDARTGTPYWVVENSWGRVYDNDAALGNNGAGPLHADIPKNHFVLIANRVAGRGGLEMTNREFFSARQ